MNIEAATKWIENMPAWLLTVIAILLVGYALKRIKTFPNYFIPLAIMALGPVFLILSRYGMMRFVVEGIVYAGTAWMLHAQIWKRFVAPHLGKDAGEGFDTAEIRKTDTETPKDK